jgi:PAS domain S-box-containing protein
MNTDKKFTVLANLAPVGIYLTDPEGDCSYANPAWLNMAGMKLEDALGKGWVNGIHPDDRKLVFESWEKMVNSNGKWGMEYRFQTSDGKITIVYGLANPEYDERGKIISYVGINIDMTDLKKMEGELRLKITELESINKLMMNRELKMVELKHEVEDLKK